MIPASHVLLLSILQFVIGLVGMLVRRSGTVVLVSGLIMINSVILALCALGPRVLGAGLQGAGMAVLAVLVSVALVGAAVLYSFHRYRRAVAIDEHDRMKR